MWKRKISGFIKKYRTYLLIALAAVCLAVFITGALWVIFRLKEPVIHVQYAVPQDVSWYLETSDPFRLWKKLETENELVNELRQFSFFEDIYAEIHFIDSLINVDKDTRELLEGHPFILACRFNGEDEDFLFLQNLSDVHSAARVNDFFKNRFASQVTLREDLYDGVLYVEGVMHDGSVFYYACKNGIFIFSRKLEMLEGAIASLNQGTGLVQDPEFKGMLATTGKNVDANIYLNWEQIAGPFMGLLTEDKQEMRSFFSTFGNWAGLDLIARDDELTFSGYSRREIGTYLSVIAANKPQKISMQRILPFNTALMLFIGSDDMGRYCHELKVFRKGLDDKNVDPWAFRFENKNFDPDQAVFSWMGTEAAMVITASPAGDFRSHAYGVFAVKNMVQAVDYLTAMSVSVGEEYPDDSDSTSIVIRKLVLQDIFPSLFGRSFSLLTETYYMFLEDYVIVGNSPRALRLFAASFLSGKTLEKNENYVSFTENVSDEASLCLYVNIRKTAELIKVFVRSDIRKSMDEGASALRNFQAFAIQFSAEDEMVYTNVYLRHNPSYKDENPAIWEISADTTIVNGPYAFTSENKKGMLFTDASGILYFVDFLGRTQWKFNPGGPIMGGICICNRYNNEKRQILFNTRYKIFMLDEQGKNVNGFPYTMRHPASSPMALLTSPSNSSLCIYFVSDDHKLHCISLSGKPQAGWQTPLIGAAVFEKPEHISMLGRDYYIATDGNGICHFYNNKGAPAFLPETTEFIKAKNVAFFLFPDGKQSRIITTDRKGRIIRVSADGNWESITLGTFSSNHYFLYDDFSGNGLRDYIYADSNTVAVYNVNTKMIFELELDGIITGGIYKLKIPGAGPYFAVISATNAKVFVFSFKGLSPVSNYLKGSLGFAQGTFEKNEVPGLGTSHGHTLYYYYLLDLFPK